LQRRRTGLYRCADRCQPHRRFELAAWAV